MKVRSAADPLEHEADRAAAEATAVPARPADPLSKASPSSPGHRLGNFRTHATSATAGGSSLSVEPGVWRAMGRREGRPLHQGLRRHFEAAYGHPLDNVRVHTGPLARSISSALRADGVTDGRNIALRRPDFATPETTRPRVLAHELAHVRQQQGQPGSVLFRVPWEIDEGRYFTDRGGAVVRARELQQTYTSLEIFQRDDGNWQVRYRHGVPQPDSYPAIDTGLYYDDQAGADRRASHLRAYGFVVEVFQREDDNWQVRLLRLQGSRPSLPTSTGPDAGFYYSERGPADRRAEALRAAGFSVTVVERDDGNFQANITALPSFGGSGGQATQAPQDGAATEGQTDTTVAEQEAEAGAAEATEGEASGDVSGLDVHQRVANFVDLMNTSLTTLRTARLTELQEAAPDDDARAAVSLPSISMTIASFEVRSPEQQARNIVNGVSWTCRSAHLGDNARHVYLWIGDEISWSPQAEITEAFGSDFYNDFVEAWNEAMLDQDLRNYEAGHGWAPGDAYHLEMPVRNVPQESLDACIAEYVRLTREEGEDQVQVVEDLYEDEIEAVEAED